MSEDPWDSYFYPETYDGSIGQGTLRNLYDEHDRNALHHLEYVASRARQAELIRNPSLVPRTYDASQLRGHHHQPDHALRPGLGPFVPPPYLP